MAQPLAEGAADDEPQHEGEAPDDVEAALSVSPGISPPCHSERRPKVRDADEQADGALQQGHRQAAHAHAAVRAVARPHHVVQGLLALPERAHAQRGLAVVLHQEGNNDRSGARIGLANSRARSKCLNSTDLLHESGSRF